MEIAETIKVVADYGILVVIAGVFLLQTYRMNNMIKPQRDVITIGRNNHTVLGSSSRLIDNWDKTISITGNKLSRVSNGVKVSGNTSKVLVNIHVAYRHLTGGGTISPSLSILKNGNVWFSFYYNKIDNTLQSLPMIVPNHIVNVKKGDGIRVRITAATNSRYDDGTYMTVEAIE